MKMMLNESESDFVSSCEIFFSPTKKKKIEIWNYSTIQFNDNW